MTLLLAVLLSVVAVLLGLQLWLRHRLRPWLNQPLRWLFDAAIAVFVAIPLVLVLLRRCGVHLTASRIRLFMYAFTVWHLGSWLLLGMLGSARLTAQIGRRLRSSASSDRDGGGGAGLDGRPPDTDPIAPTPARAVAGPTDPARRRLLGAGVAAAALGATGVAGLLVKRTRDVHLEELTVPLRRLPASLDGSVLVQISDLHVGVFLSQRELERVVAQVNDLGADWVAMTGDLVDNAPVFIPALARAVERLRPRRGTLAVLGNHDFYTGAGQVAAALQKREVRVLRNRHLVIDGKGAILGEGTADGAAGGSRSEGAGLVIAGIDDPAGRYYEGGAGADPRGALSGAPAGTPRVLLSHRPDIFPWAVDAGIDLTLSGHTHGGQLVIPWVGSAARIITPFPVGLYRRGSAHLYVNRGLGVVGLPVRLNCRAEVTRLLLRSA